MRLPVPNVGPYRLETLLGRGGMGEVYKARDTRLGRWVAVKRLQAQRLEAPAARRRFRREARALAQLRHPAIVQIYDLIEDADGDWIVMEWLSGPSLRSLVDGPPLAVPRVVDLARQIAGGLMAAHGQGIVHRDLKTENVLLCEPGDGSGETQLGPVDAVKIVDFGLAQQRWDDDSPVVVGPETLSAESSPSQSRHGLSVSGQVLGTPRAMSPEQAQGLEVDARSDLFSLGIVLYELLAGHSPFKGRSLVETLERLRHHRPPPVRRFQPSAPPELEQLIGRLLDKDPGCRPPSAAAVLESLESIARRRPIKLRGAPSLGRKARRDDDPVRRWPEPPLPPEPYPVLLPYVHPALLAGRDAELLQLQRLLRMAIPILGLCAPSGTGKSSLLSAGLVPLMRRQGYGVAMVRHPREPQLALRLVSDLLLDTEARHDITAPELADELETVARWTRRPAILVIDQLEDIFAVEDGAADAGRASGDSARAVLGRLIAATAVPRPGREAPSCRWLLAYRQEVHGRLLQWLQDVLAEARRESASAVEDWPTDFSGAERFHSMALHPLATLGPGRDSEADVTAVFETIIERPLALCDAAGEPHYGKHFAPGHARRLAQAFAAARRALPSAPLGPELQVVLAHLMADSGQATRLTVAQDPSGLIDAALEDHLRRVLEEAFPLPGGDGDSGRTRAILALRELATASGRKDDGLPMETLISTLGPGGRRVLDILAQPLNRLVVLHERGDGWCYRLSHDAMAAVVVRLVEQEGRPSTVLLDERLLSMRRLVTLRTALFAEPSTQANDAAATRLSAADYRRIAAHHETLICDQERRRWWQACRRRRRIDRRRKGLALTAVTLCLLAVVWVTARWTVQRADQRLRLDHLVHAKPEVALRELSALQRRGDLHNDELLALLRQRSAPLDILSQGLGGLEGSPLGSAVLQTVEMVLPWIEESPEDWVLVASAISALDYVMHHQPEHRAAGVILRRRALEPLRRLYPPPSVDAVDENWVQVAGGSFMPRGGAVHGARRSAHGGEITVSSFRMLRHEVTYQQLRRLMPERQGGDRHPAAGVNWYEAYAYAAWLGGRLPTDAEWEYAAQADCPHAFCGSDGRPTEIDDIACTRRISLIVEGRLAPRPVMSLQANPWGLYDMIGNLWEWTADGYHGVGERAARDPWAHAEWRQGARIYRGGSFLVEPAMAGTGSHNWIIPEHSARDTGFRVVLPGLGGGGGP